MRQLTADSKQYAANSVSDYLDDMVKALDKKFGTDYAKANPILLGKLVAACVQEYRNHVLDETRRDADFHASTKS